MWCVLSPPHPWRASGGILPLTKHFLDWLLMSRPSVHRMCSFREDASNPRCLAMVRSLWKKGHTFREIAKMLNIGVVSVNRCLNPDTARSVREAGRRPLTQNRSRGGLRCSSTLSTTERLYPPFPPAPRTSNVHGRTKRLRLLFPHTLHDSAPEFFLSSC